MRRVGFVASEVVRHGGAVVCALVSPYRATRDEVRALIGRACFIEVFVDTPLEVCARRDVKGLYTRARRGAVTGVSGLDAPYEPPADPAVTLDTVSNTVEVNARSVLRVLRARGFVAGACGTPAVDVRRADDMRCGGMARAVAAASERRPLVDVAA